jgi:UPF0755 protein
MSASSDDNQDNTEYDLLDELQSLRERMRDDLPESAQAFGIYLVSILVAVLCITGAYLIQIPNYFPTNTVVTVKKGQSIQEVATHLQKRRVITSPFVFRLLVEKWNKSDTVVAGEYYFQKPRSVFAVARRLSDGAFGLVPHAVTIPEGATSFQIADLLEDKLGEKNFDTQEFLHHARPLEGYLFPDTYSFLPNTDEREIVKTMQQNFHQQIDTIREKIQSFGKPLRDVVVMASLLEKEARTTKSRRIISGILWKRLRMDMRLQVDAVFTYINGKSTFDLTYDDLRNDSPYNTYRYHGLPAGPIANPGLDSLKAAIHPTKTDYLYYLSDMQGNMHYAKNLEQHKANKRLYLH